MGSGSPLAVIWDFDLTLVDTRQRNLNVSRRLIKEQTGRDPDDFAVLRSVEAYDAAHRLTRNWQEFYRQAFSFSQEEIEASADLWTRYQLEDDTPAPVLGGIEKALKALQWLPHGIVSQNARPSIEVQLEALGIGGYFSHIVGYEDVGINRQKPAPDGLLQCLDRLVNGASGTVLFVGDHETDIICGQRANHALVEREADVRVATVAALFVDQEISGWKVEPDYRATSPQDLVTLARDSETTNRPKIAFRFR
jgi:HAD superfamily hydrolase (TIGR01549 family)